MPPMGLQQIPQQGVRVRGCLSAAALRLGTANLPWALHHQPVNFTPPQGNPWKTGRGRRKITFEPGQGASGLMIRLLWVLAASADQKQWQKHLSGMESPNTVLTWTLRVTKAHYLPLWAVAVSAVEEQQTEQKGTQCGSWQDSNLEHFCHINSSASHSSFASSSISK